MDGDAEGKEGGDTLQLMGLLPADGAIVLVEMALVAEPFILGHGTDGVKAGLFLQFIGDLTMLHKWRRSSAYS
jgi:hypothetical protein